MNGTLADDASPHRAALGRKELAMPNSFVKNFMKKMKARGTETDPAEIAERKDANGAWIVEVVDSDGGIEQAIFAGPRSRERAEAYARLQYRS
jgi:hypothetical protein